VEQEYGEPNSATSLAARTVLPGEPFDAPAASAVPGPRDVPLEAPEQAPQHPDAQQWNYGPPAAGDLAAPPRSFDPATYDPTYGEVVDPHHDPAMYTPTYATADSLTEPDQFESLHQFGALPVAEAPAYAAYDVSAPPAYPAPAAAPAYPAPSEQSGVYSAFPAPSAPAWPAQEHPTSEPMYSASAPGEALVAPPMPQADEPPAGEDAEGTHRKSNRRPSTPILVLAAVVVLGGGGYFGYTQLSKSDSSSTTSDGPVVVPNAKTPANTTPVTPTGTVAYAFPNHVAGFPLRTNVNAAALKRQITSFAKKSYPAFMGAPQIASFGSAGTASVVAYTFHPAASKLAGAYSTMVTGVQKPAAGNVVGAFTSVPPGAAGGSMTCGSQSGVSPISYCVWKGASTVGVVYVKGSTATPNTQALTRELRAYAEH
jgi:hypothetical protein